MTAPGFPSSRGTGHLAAVRDEDVRAAQVTLDAWLAALVGTEDTTTVTAQAALVLRGILAGQFADVRAAGYYAGHTDATDLATFECAHVPILNGLCTLCGQPVEP